ncbi:MAG TPA: HRDC domain-containing protein [bacterium]|nr:HRDC domain-containing protein [bacterium]
MSKLLNGITFFNGSTVASSDAADFIDKEKDLIKLVERLKKEEEIAFDIEGNSLYSYHSKICLIQISTRSENFIIDPLKIKDTSILNEIFTSPYIVKVLHGSGYDIQMLYHQSGIVIKNLFDTQIAAQFLGEKKTGLASLIEKNFYVSLDKKYQKSNWAIRPLSLEMLNYAISDTKYLLPLADRLRERLKKMQRISWVIEECEALARSVRKEKTGKTKIIRGAGKIPEKKLAIVEAIIEFRDTIAKEKDIPPFKVLDKETIFKIATSDHIDLNKIKLLTSHHRHIQKYLPELFEKIKTCPVVPRKTARHKKVNHPFFSQKAEKLHQWRQAKAETLGIQCHLVLSHNQIVVLASSNIRSLEDIEKIECLKKWQKQEFGKEIFFCCEKIPQGIAHRS